MLAVDGAQDAFALGHLQRADRGSGFDRFELERFIARDDHGARNGWQVARLTALLVVLNELVNFLADDLPLIRLLARGYPPLQQIPVHLRLNRRRFLPAAPDGLRLLTVAQNLEPHELVDIACRQRRLVELDSELLHPNGRDADHKNVPPSGAEPNARGQSYRVSPVESQGVPTPSLNPMD